MANCVSSHFDHEIAEKHPELLIREAYLRTVKEILDGMGLERYTLDQIRGATEMLEKFLEINEEMYKR